MSYLINYIKEYGLGIFLCTSFTRVLNKFHAPKRFILRYTNFKHRRVSKYLLKHYPELVDEDCKYYNKPAFQEKYNVWVFWWQGEDKVPEVVKICLNSIKRNTGLEVIVISKFNYKNFIELPEYIIEKVNAGKICLPNFSDVIRFNLLYRHGGIWLDATDFVTAPIPQYIKNYSFFSVPNAFKNSLGWKWTSFYMAARKGDYLCGRMVEYFNRFWKDHNISITYLYLDCWLTVLYHNNKIVKEEIDSYSNEEIDIFALSSIINNSFKEDEFLKALKDSYIHKLSYKDNYQEKKDGAITIWGYLKQNENTNAC